MTEQSTDEQERMIGKVVRVAEDGASWGTTAYGEREIITTLCAHASYDPDQVRQALAAAEEQGLLVRIDEEYIPGEGYEKYLRPGVIGSEVDP